MRAGKHVPFDDFSDSLEDIILSEAYTYIFERILELLSIS